MIDDLEFFSKSGRKLDFDQKVSTTPNGQRAGGAFTLTQNGEVKGYADRFYLLSVTFEVDEARQAEMRRTGRGNRHAVLEGFVVRDEKLIYDYVKRGKPIRIYYNPLELDCFVDIDSGEEVWSAPLVFFTVTSDMQPRVYAWS